MSERLRPVKTRKLIAVLRANGLLECPDRGKGSHTWFRHPGDPKRHTAVPDRGEISGGLLSGILAQAGKTREEFQERLKEV